MGQLFERLVAPFIAVAEPASDFFWAYLASYAAIAGCLYLWREAQPSPGGFLRFLLPRDVYRHPSARLDLLIWAINAVVLVSPAAVVSAWAGSSLAGGLTALAGPPPLTLAAGMPWSQLYTLVLFMAGDLGIYLGHLLLHRSPLLWEFHKVHHSAPVLMPVTAFRQHPVDGVITGATAGLCTGLVAGLFNWLAPEGLDVLMLLRHNMVELAFIAAGIHFRHSHIWLHYGKTASWVLLSPCMHQIHHSGDQRHYDKNLGLALSLWDHLFGTAYVPEQRESLTFGLGGEESEYQTLKACYLLPFRKAALLIAGRRQAA